MEYYYSRRTLLHTPFAGHPAGPSSSHPAGATPEDGGGSAPSGSGGNSTFDANVVMILAVLLCALICALGINSIVRCALRCSSSSRRSDAGAPNPAAAQGGGGGGLRRKALRAMPVLLYSPGLKLSAAAPMCAVCLCDFEAGEHVRVLPKCNHGFHVRCIDRWLLARSTCPTCRQSLFGAPHRASGCSDSDHHHQAIEAAPGPGGVALAPLRREGLAVSTPYDF